MVPVSFVRFCFATTYLKPKLQVLNPQEFLMAQEKSAMVPRKVTQEDKDAAAEKLVPHLGGLDKHQAARAKQLFGELRGLTLLQVEAIILEVKRKTMRNAS
jgi:hypothetical protein